MRYLFAFLLLGCRGPGIAPPAVADVTSTTGSNGACDCEATVYTLETSDGVFDGVDFCDVASLGPDETMVSALWFDGEDWRTDVPDGPWMQRGNAVGYWTAVGCRDVAQRYRVVVTTL